MEGAIAVVRYPKFSPDDAGWVEDFRKKNDRYFDMIRAHLTLVFPLFEMNKKVFIREIRQQSEGFDAYALNINCAIRNNDLTSDLWHALLVPDEGFSNTVKLHDQLYSGILASQERLDLDFIPHVAIGNSPDPMVCKRMVDEINARQIHLKAQVNILDIIEIKNGKAETIERIALK